MCFIWEGAISTLRSGPLKLVAKFTYLSSNVSSTKSDVNIHLAKVWTAIDSLLFIWKFDLSNKMGFFSRLCKYYNMYTPHGHKKNALWKISGGNNIKMSWAFLNKSWKQHPTLLPISKTIQVRQTRHAEHCWRSKNELMNDVLLLTSIRVCASAGWPARTYSNQLCVDTGCRLENLLAAMNDRDRWRES